MRKQLTFQGATTYFPFPTKRLLGKKHKNSILKRFPYPDLGSASDWSYCEGNLLQLIRSTTQIFTVFNKVLSRRQKLWSRWRRKNSHWKRELLGVLGGPLRVHFQHSGAKTKEFEQSTDISCRLNCLTVKFPTFCLVWAILLLTLSVSSFHWAFPRFLWYTIVI